MVKNQNKNIVTEVIMFFTVFIIAHTFEVYVNYYTAVKDNYILGLILRLSIWTLPVFLLTLSQNPFTHLKLKNNVVAGIIIGIILGMLLCALRCLILYYFNNTFSINLDLPAGAWLNVIILVGLSEEVVFRGYLLQKIEAISNFWTANIMSTILFIFMHLPVWLIGKNLGIIEIAQNIGSLLWLSLLLGFVFKKSKSLWACMIIHSFNNFMSVAIT